MPHPDVVIVSGARTPMAEWIGGKRGDGLPGGALASVSALALGAVAARAAIARAGVPAERFDHCVVGNALQTSGDALYGARHVALEAGLPVECPALTVNRLCGSGLQSVATAAQMLRLGEATWVLAGGTENMSQAPHVLRGARAGLRFGASPALEDSLFVALRDTRCDLVMAQTSDNLARRYGITREEQDRFAFNSQMKWKAAHEQGLFGDEIMPVEITQRKGPPIVFDTDEHPRPDTTMEALAKLRPAFAKDAAGGGTVTAGNASGVNDGAAALLLVEADTARRLGLKPIVFVGPSATAGVDPAIMGVGPVPATKKALARARLTMSDIELFELNEAFAAQSIACIRDLGLDESRVNVNGGAIAIGHPLGASGARIATTLIHEMRRRKSKHGVAALCVGVGQGVATVFHGVE